MCRTYLVTAPQAWGVATPFVDGIQFTYNDVGSQAAMRWNASTNLPFAFTSPFMIWDHYSNDPDEQVLLIEFGIWIITDPPFFTQWVTQEVILIPESRKPFIYPQPIDNPGDLPGGMGGPLEIRPLNDYAQSVWT
ncbi:unnamed protein product [marine sediment metagenome]|uniref:Uncharacterized protein n=3 Tax=marine sediment metagenome TaxID=412755 RepID=X0Z6U2_9ZZZZ